MLTSKFIIYQYLVPPGLSKNNLLGFLANNLSGTFDKHTFQGFRKITQSKELNMTSNKDAAWPVT